MKPHLCSECGKQFETRDRFNTHLRKKHSIEICEVKNHRKKKYHENKKFKESSEQFLSENSGDVHERKKRKIDFEFSENYIKTMKSDNSPDIINKSDVSTIHEKKKTQCDICGKDFMTLKDYQKNLNAHLRDAHHIGKISDRKQLKLRKNESSKESAKAEKKKLSKPFSCAICGKKLTTNTNMLIHMAYAHDGPKPYNCSKCGKKFAVKVRLDEHLKCKKNNCYNEINGEKLVSLRDWNILICSWVIN